MTWKCFFFFFRFPPCNILDNYCEHHQIAATLGLIADNAKMSRQHKIYIACWLTYSIKITSVLVLELFHLTCRQMNICQQEKKSRRGGGYITLIITQHVFSRPIKEKNSSKSAQKRQEHNACYQCDWQLQKNWLYENNTHTAVMLVFEGDEVLSRSLWL